MDETKRDPDKLREKLLTFAGSFPLFQLVGLELAEIAPGHAKMQLAIRSELHNPSGVVHGGVLATMIDTTITQALLMTDAYQRVRETRGTLSTVDLHVKYLRPAVTGVLTCEAGVTHMGKRVIHAHATVRNEQSKDIAVGDATMMIVLGDG